MVGSPCPPISAPPFFSHRPTPGREGDSNAPVHPLSLTLAAITLIAAPAGAQELTATLRIHGDVMVSMGGDFQDATDGQPIVPGNRIMVGDGASATVRFSQDCKRTYNQAGVYTITPVLCDEDERKRRTEEGGEQGAEVGGNSPLTAAGIILGTVVAFPLVVDLVDDDPASR